MSKTRIAAATLTMGAAFAGFGEVAPAAAVSTHELTIAKLAQDHAKLKALSKVALNQFEKNMKSGGATIWVFAGVCSVMGERYPHQPKGVEVAGIVPDPGILHIKVPHTDIIFTEGVTWDGALKKYVTGQVSLISKKAGTAYNPKGLADQYNLYFDNADLRDVNVHFSGSENAVVTSVNGGEMHVMDDIEVAIGKDVKTIANEPSIQEICRNGNVQTPSSSTST